jgi:hypothetical protein
MVLSGKMGIKTHIENHKEYLTDTDITLWQVKIDKPLQISGGKGAAIGGFHVIDPPQIIFQIGQWAVPAEKIKDERKEKSTQMKDGHLWPPPCKEDPKYEKQNPRKMQENGDVGQDTVNHSRPLRPSHSLTCLRHFAISEGTSSRVMVRL